MDLKPLSILTTTLFVFILGTYVFAKNPKKIINISFLALLYSSGAWALALFVISVGSRDEVLRFAGHVAFAAGPLMASNFLLFAYVFPQKRDEFPPLRIWLLLYAPAVFVSALGFTPLVMQDIVYVGGVVRPVYGKGIFIQIVFDIAYSGAALYLLARKYFTQASRSTPVH
jgi:hypothetical protein